MKKPKRNPGQVIDIDDLIDSMPEDGLMGAKLQYDDICKIPLSISRLTAAS